MSDAGALHRAMFDAVVARDWTALRDLYHPDYVYTGSDGTEHKGAEAGLAVAEMYTSAFPDLTFEFRDQFTPGDAVSIVEFTARGTHQGQLEDIPATGRPVEIVVCNVIEVADGKIHREREYFDSLAMMQQLGVVPD